MRVKEVALWKRGKEKTMESKEEEEGLEVGVGHWSKNERFNVHHEFAGQFSL